MLILLRMSLCTHIFIDIYQVTGCSSSGQSASAVLFLGTFQWWFTACFMEMQSLMRIEAICHGVHVLVILQCRSSV